MIRSKKWIEAAEPDQPLSKFARKALKLRIKAVWYYAGLVASNEATDPEAVHQLRVATRRARAALKLFTDLLPRRKRRWVNGWLRRLRSAAGEARDLDVLGGRLAKIANESRDDDLRKLVKRIEKQRVKTWQPLADTIKRARRKKFKPQSLKLAKAARWRRGRQEPTLAEAAPALLRPLVNNFLLATRADLTSTAALHRLRIRGKQLRYGMELLAPAFDESFRGELYKAMTKVQDRLGEINDHAAAIAMFSKWNGAADQGEARADLFTLIAEEQRQLEAKRRDFAQWWNAGRAIALEQEFERPLRADRPN